MGITLAVLLATPGNTAERLIDDFEDAGSLQSWEFGNGHEFPGATGSFTLGAGRIGRGGHLTYNIIPGSNYVRAVKSEALSADAGMLSYWVKWPPLQRTRLRVLDDTFQTLQYNLNRPFEVKDGAAWTRIAFHFSQVPPSGWGGGANDGVLHYPTRQIHILAGDPVLKPVAGTYVFDDVRFTDEVAGVLDPHGPVVPSGLDGGHPLTDLGVTTHLSASEAQLDWAADAGFRWVRAAAVWPDLESDAGLYDFSSVDTFVQRLQARGLTAHLVLGQVNPLYGADAPRTSQAIAAFGDYAAALAQHLGETPTAFEIWAEPNNSWPPGPNAAEYAALATATAARIRQVSASAQVVTGALFQTDYAYVMGLADAGVGQVDAVSLHVSRNWRSETLSDDVVATRHLLGAAPLWHLQTSVSSAYFGNGTDATSRQRQALNVARHLLTHVALEVPRVAYGFLVDPGSTPNNHWEHQGLLTPALAEKPALVAARLLLQQVSERRYVGIVPMTPSTVHALRFDGASDTLIALWNEDESPTGAVPITLPPPLEAIDYLGNPVDLSVGAVHLTAAMGPLYLSYPKAPEPDADGGVAVDGGSWLPGAPGAGPDFTPTVDEPPVIPQGCGCGASSGAALAFAALALLRVRTRRR